MAQHRYHLPRGPRRHPERYRIVNRDKKFLSNTLALPWTWTDREMTAVSFPSRAQAQAFIRDKFMGDAAARMAGIQVVP